MTTTWQDVPDDLLYLLSQRLLGLSTFVRFGSVCRDWHLFSLANKKCYQPSPWLMLSEKEGTDNREFFDISTSEVYELPLPQARGRKIVGSAHGWVMTVGEDLRIHLLNPLDGAQIELPPIDCFPDIPRTWLGNPQKCRNLFLRKATWSANPTDCNGDFSVMVMHLNSCTPCLSFCRYSDKKWTTYQTARPNQVAFAGGQFYAVDDGRILSWDISIKSAPRSSQIGASALHSRIWNYYIVDCGGELLFLVKHRDFDDPDEEPDFDDEHEAYTFQTLGFLVYKIDWVGQKLTEIQDIGDYALFLGYNNSISLPIASDYGNKQFKRNCIYFTYDGSDPLTPTLEVEGGKDMGVCCLDESSDLDRRRIQPFYPDVSNSSFSFPIWFVPHPSDRDDPGNANRS